MIDITGTDLVKFAQNVFDLSSAQGMGFFHASDEPLSDEDAESLIRYDVNQECRGIALSMDYVIGRACKMTVFREGDKLLISDAWFDHSEEQLKELLKRSK